MPRGDGTGRNGLGPMTGRGLGYCAGYDMPGYVNGLGYQAGYGRGRFVGRGRGLHLGMGYGRSLFANRYPLYPPAHDAASEREVLAEEAGALEQQLAAVKKRLDMLDKEKEVSK